MANEIIDVEWTDDTNKVEETTLSPEVEKEDKKDGKVVAAIVGGAAVLTGGLAFGGYKIYKNFISKTGRVEYLEKKREKAATKTAKIELKLDKAKEAIKPNVQDVSTETKPEPEKN